MQNVEIFIVIDALWVYLWHEKMKHKCHRYAI